MALQHLHFTLNVILLPTEFSIPTLVQGYDLYVSRYQMETTEI